MEELIVRGWEGLVGRVAGPMPFRLIFQPAMAALLALLAGFLTSTTLWRRAESARGLAETNAVQAQASAAAAR